MSSSDRRFLIGRAYECDIVLDAPSVSRQHAQLVVTSKGHLLLVDRRSHNGTLVSDGGRMRRISQEIVQPGDTVQFGDVTMAVSELLRRVQSHLPASRVPPVPAADHQAHGTPWVRAKHLVRCDGCGVVKQKDGACTVCGQ